MKGCIAISKSPVATTKGTSTPCLGEGGGRGGGGPKSLSWTNPRRAQMGFVYSIFRSNNCLNYPLQVKDGHGFMLAIISSQTPCYFSKPGFIS